MRWVALALVGGLLGCGREASPCIPEGTYDFFLVRSVSAVTQAGTITFASDGGAGLLVDGEPARACALSHASDDRQAPIGACQLGWSCEPTECPGCTRWILGLMYRPAPDGVLPQGTVLAPGESNFEGSWSAAPRGTP